MRSHANHPHPAPHGACVDHDAFIESLASFSRTHRPQRWEGTFGQFLADIAPTRPAAMVRTSRGYVWDMLRWHGRVTPHGEERSAPEGSDASAQAERPGELFRRELFGIDGPFSRVAEYFKAAAGGSDVGRRPVRLATADPDGVPVQLSAP